MDGPNDQLLAGDLVCSVCAFVICALAKEKRSRINLVGLRPPALMLQKSDLP
jgi:hypothetical protein